MSARIDARGINVERDGACILRDVTFSAGGGEFVGVIGPNGAGKTTLLRVIAGLEPLASGACLVDGDPVGALNPLGRARKISYLPQSRPIYWSMTVESIVALGRFAFGAPERLEGDDAAAVARAISSAGVDALTGRAATALSGGEAARVHIARALAAETSILLADEPTASLDPRHQLAIMSVLKKRAEGGALIIAALHDLALAAKFCSRIIILADGRLAADDAPVEALSARNIAYAFGVNADIVVKDGRARINFEN